MDDRLRAPDPRHSRLARWAAMAGIALLFFARSASCSLVLGSYHPLDDVPYASFDRHGMSSGLGLMGTLVFIGPVLWLARQVIGPPPLPHGSAIGRKVVVRSAAVALAVALPSFVQLDYMLALPLHVMWPVVVTAVVWAGVVGALWAVWLRAGGPGARRIGGRAAVLALLMTLTKLMLLGS